MAGLETLGGVLLALLGGVGLFETARDYRRCRHAPHWPGVPGKILESRVKTSGRWSDDTTETHRLRYEYEVEGQRFEGRRLHAGQELDLTLGSGWSSVRQSAWRYQPGDTVTVRYNPTRPSECCLEPGGVPGVILKLVFCVGLVGAGLWLVV